MADIPTPPVWGTPPPSAAEPEPGRPTEPAGHPVTADAPQSSWLLDCDDDSCYGNCPLPVVITGTEQDAMRRLVDIATESVAAYRLFTVEGVVG